MFNKIKYAVRKIRKAYYKFMWTRCMNKMKQCSLNDDYKTSYVWKEKANVYFRKQKELTK